MAEKIKIGINGFGRIGRYVAKLVLQNDAMQLTAVNDLASAETLVHLLKYDSVHGQIDGELELNDNTLHTSAGTTTFSQEKNPQNIPWEKQDVDIVIECTGQFKTKLEAEKHLGNTVKNVIISAPASDSEVKMVVMGINDEIIEPDDRVISCASCTTNSAAPLVKIMNKIAGIESCYITTIHSFTNDQRLHDAPHKDLRRARAATQSIVPTSTGAAKAITKIFPDLSNVIGGCGIRVPVPDGSLTDMTFVIDKAPSVDEVNEAFYKAAQGELSSILGYTEDPIVSVDILGNPMSCLFDAKLTSVVGNMVKVMGWYDNEAGYSNRIIDLTKKLYSLPYKM